MPVVSSSMGLGAPLSVDLPPRENRSTHFQKSANLPRCNAARISMRFESLRHRRVPAVCAAGLGSKSQLAERKRLTFSSNRMNSAFVCAAARNAKCSQGQTQTVTREAPTITKAPVHEKEKSPKLDDGGSGFPPRDDGDGGGGGGGGGNSSGGFFLFGFLLFLGFLKDIEGEEEYRGGRRR